MNAEREIIIIPTKNSRSQYFWQFLVNFLVIVLSGVILLLLGATIMGSSKGIISSQFKAGEFCYPQNPRDNWLTEVVLPKSVKDELTVWLNSYKYLPSNLLGEELTSGEHLLFSGPPGSGKSYLAEVFARHESLAYAVVNFGGEFLVGSSKSKQEKILQEAKKIIAQARKKTGQEKTKPVVIIIDEIDSIATKNFSGNSSNSDEAANGLLTLIDEIRREKLNIIIIGTTNHSSVLDSAIVRSGRFGRQIKFSYPNEAEIGQMVRHLSRKVQLHQAKTIKIIWENNYWDKVQRISQELGKKYQVKELGITILDLEKALKYSWAQAIDPLTKEIKAQSASYQTELEKILQNKECQKSSTNFLGNSQLSSTLTDLFKKFASNPLPNV